MHLVVDATGLKVYGEGEWKVKVHGASKRRVWRKLHILVDEKTGEVLPCCLTESRPVLPRRTAQVRSDDPGFAERNRNVEQIREVGRQRWKEESGYTRRSLAETGFMRLKTIFGAALGARIFASQVAEARLRCAALNRMTQLAMPESYAVPRPA